MTARHARHHELVAQREVEWHTVPRRRSVGEYYRQAGYRARVTLRGHLVGLHGMHPGPFATYDELTALHAAADHPAASGVPLTGHAAAQALPPTNNPAPARGGGRGG